MSCRASGLRTTSTDITARSRTQTWSSSPSGLRCCASPPADPVPPHDLQQAGVVGETELLGRLGDVPVIALERGHDDLPLRFRLQRVECHGDAPGPPVPPPHPPLLSPPRPP